MGGIIRQRLQRINALDVYDSCMMRIDQLRCFVAVVDLGSFRAAADAMRRSQPAVSRSVAQLQATCADRLLEPAGRGVRVTSAGRAFADRARDVLERFDQLTEPVETDSRLLVAAHEPFSAPLLPAVLADHLDPGVDVDLLDDAPPAIDALLATGAAHVAITTHPGHGGGDVRRIGTMRCRCYARIGTDAAAARSLDWVAPVSAITATANDATALDAWPAEAPRTVAIRVTMLASAVELCARGRARAWLPDPVVALHNERVHARWRLAPLAGRTLPSPVDVPVFLRLGAAGAPDDRRSPQLVDGLGRLLSLRPRVAR